MEELARRMAARELGLTGENNPDLITLRYNLLSVADARRINELAAQSPFAGEHKALVVVASRIYHEAQNALLKLFEEPPEGTTLFLLIPDAGMLLPTLRSRVMLFAARPVRAGQEVDATFLRASREQRGEMIKKLMSADDDEEKRRARDEALQIVNDIERALYEKGGVEKHQELLGELAVFRDCLYDRAAPTKMILEHLAIVTPAFAK